MSSLSSGMSAETQSLCAGSLVLHSMLIRSRKRLGSVARILADVLRLTNNMSLAAGRSGNPTPRTMPLINRGVLAFSRSIVNGQSLWLMYSWYAFFSGRRSGSHPILPAETDRDLPGRRKMYTNVLSPRVEFLCIKVNEYSRSGFFHPKGEGEQTLAC